MTRKQKKAAAAGPPVTTVVVMRLYVAGKAPNSVKAIANLGAICQQYLKDGYKLEIVDVCEHPRRALADGVLVTPSLAKMSPAPASMSSATSATRTACWQRSDCRREAWWNESGVAPGREAFPTSRQRLRLRSGFAASLRGLRRASL